MGVGQPAHVAPISSLTPRLRLRSPSSTSSLALETWLFSSVILGTSILLLHQFLGLTIPFPRGLHNLGFFPLETSFQNLLSAPQVGPGGLICWVTHPLPRPLPPSPPLSTWGQPRPLHSPPEPSSARASSISQGGQTEADCLLSSVAKLKRNFQICPAMQRGLLRLH